MIFGPENLPMYRGDETWKHAGFIDLILSHFLKLNILQIKQLSIVVDGDSSLSAAVMDGYSW